MLLSDFIKQDRKVQELEANALRLQCATNQRLQPTRFAPRGMSVDSAPFRTTQKGNEYAFAKTPRARRRSDLLYDLYARDASRSDCSRRLRRAFSPQFSHELEQNEFARVKERQREIERRDATSRNHDDRRGGHQTGNVCQPSSRKDAFTRCWRVASLRRPTAGRNGDRPQYYHPSHRLRA